MCQNCGSDEHFMNSKDCKKSFMRHQLENGTPEYNYCTKSLRGMGKTLKIKIRQQKLLSQEKVLKLDEFDALQILLSYKEEETALLKH